jgi:hypothetical protein
MRKIVRGVVATSAMTVGLLGFGAVASAAPSNAPTSLSGTFICPGGVTGTFVTNSGNTHAAQTWNVAHLTFENGGKGIFVPTTLSLTFTSPEGTFTSTSTKGNAPSSVTCTISASPGPGYSLSGQVTGNIVTNG